MFRPAQDVIRGWDLISTSLVKMEKINDEDHYPFGEYIFVLDMPPQNIIGTIARDTGVLNYIGVDRSGGIDPDMIGKLQADALLGQYLRGEWKHPKHEWVGCDEKLTPKHLDPAGLIQQNRIAYRDGNASTYNEVIVVGKPFTQLRKGELATREIKVDEIIFMPFNDKGYGPTFNNMQEKW